MKAMTKTEPTRAAGVSFRIIALRTGLSGKEPELMRISFNAHPILPVRVKHPAEKYGPAPGEELQKGAPISFFPPKVDNSRQFLPIPAGMLPGCCIFAP